MDIKKPLQKSTLLSGVDKYRELVIVTAIFFIMIIFASVMFPTFRSSENVRNVLMQCTALGLVSLGQYFAVLSGSLDLSVGSVVSIVTILSSGLINGKPEMVAPVILLVLLLGLLIGFLNGIFVVKLKLNPVVVTLGMMSIVQGAAFAYSLTAIGSLPTWFGKIALDTLGPFPSIFIVLVIMMVVAYLVLEKTVYGRYIHATGGNDNVAHLAGINSDRIKISAHMICSFMTALAGIFLVSRMGIGSPQLGQSFLVDSLVVVLLSGAGLFTGIGNIAGLLPSLLIISMMNNIMNLGNVNAYWQTVIKGLILLLVVALYARKWK